MIVTDLLGAVYRVELDFILVAVQACTLSCQVTQIGRRRCIIARILIVQIALVQPHSIL